MKIVITGGAGYIGYSLIESLIEKHPAVQEILVYDNLSRKNLNFFFFGKNFGGKVRFVQGDILDNHKVMEVLRGADIVFHLAAKVTTPFAEGDFYQFDQVNNWGTSFLADALEENKVPHLVYLSSVSVYGNPTEEVDENSLANPTTNYGLSKKRGEEHLARLAEKCKVHIIRSGNVYGFNPCLRTDAVINNFIFKANFGQKLHIHGDGQQQRAFIHVKKVADVLANLVDHDLPAGTYNLAEHNYSVVEILELIREVYPALEYRFVNPDFTLRSLVVKVPGRLFDFLEMPQVSVNQEFMEFKTHFSF